MRILRSTAVLATTLAAVMALLPAMADAKPLRHKRAVAPARTVQPAPGMSDNWGNAALGGNNANSASGSNSSGENAQGRTSGGGFGG